VSSSGTQVNHRVVGIALAVLSCTLYGINPFFSVNAFDDGANSRGLMVARFLIAAPLLLAYRLLAVRGAKWPQGRDLVEIFLFGYLGFTFQSFFYFGAIERMDSGLVPGGCSSTSRAGSSELASSRRSSVCHSLQEKSHPASRSASH